MEESARVSGMGSDYETPGRTGTLTTRVSGIVRSVTSGAENLIPEMIRQGVPSTDVKVNELERDHWVVIANVFEDWPFRPSVS